MEDNYKHGEMNCDEQHKTFNGFIKAVIYVTLGCLALTAFLWIFRT